MNARSLPKTSTVLADVDLLECEVSCSTAITAATQLLSMLGLETHMQNLHLDAQCVCCTTVESSPALGRAFTAVGIAADDAQAQRCALHTAIAQWASAAFARTLPVSSMRAEELARSPGFAQTFPDLMPLLSAQADRCLATVEFCQPHGTGTLRVPLALINTSYLEAIEQNKPMPGVEDNFDYGQMRRFHVRTGPMTGASRDEALVQGLLYAHEQMCASEFQTQGVQQRTPGFIRRVMEDQLPSQTCTLLRTAAEQHGCRVHLLDIDCGHQMPTLLAYVDHVEANRRCLAIGTGFTIEHAASRALRSVIQQAQLPAKRGGSPAHPLHVPSACEIPLSVESREYLHTLIGTGQCPTVASDVRSVSVAATLEGRVATLLECFKRSGVTPWCLPYSLGTTGPMACVQIMLAPFQTSYLLQQGLPVMTSVGGRDKAANQSRSARPG